jgi:hypothetical protein
MQIFIPYNDHRLSAISLDDKRLNKQIIELGQILSTAIWIENCDIAETLYAEGKIHLPTHENHPIIINCKYYYYEALNYLYILLKEYEYRFLKRHSSYLKAKNFITCSSIFFRYQYEHKPFGNHTTNNKHIIWLYWLKDVNKAYRFCLAEKWKNDKVVPKWTNRPVPEFYKGK